MPSGGARAGAGRKPTGVLQTRKEDAIYATIRVGIKPIDVMADNLKFWFDAANSLSEQFNDLGQRLFSAESIDPQLIEDFNRIARQMFLAREKAQQCAVEMAPYRHPRINSVEIKSSADPEAGEKITKDIDVRKAAEIYAVSLLSG